MEQQFLQLVQIVERMQQRITALENANQVLIQANKQALELIEDNQRDLEAYQRNVYFELNALTETDTEYWYPVIESESVTIEEILKNGKSLARFGDGEFASIMGRVRHRFQNKIDERLQERLKEVLQSQEEGLLIGLADNYGSLEKYTDQAKREIRYYLNPQVRLEHLNLLEQNRIYYNAYVTRPYVMYKDNMGIAPKERFKHLKKIWQGRDCVIVEGMFTGTGVGNDLLEGAGSIKRILGPAENAFDKYDEILNSCKKQSKDVLFLLALGPAATVLAYDLCKAGYQAVDIGHIDLEYEWFLRGEGCRVEIEGKYNNELQQTQVLTPIQDEEYCSQIIEKLVTT